MRFIHQKYKTRLTILLILMSALLVAMFLVFMQDSNGAEPVQTTVKTPATAPAPLREPTITTQVLADGLSHPWDTALLPDGALLVNERRGRLSLIKDGTTTKVADIPGVNSGGEGGLTGMTLDADFATNRYVYTCFNAVTKSGIDVRVVRWTLSADNASLSDQNNIVIGIPSNKSGRHSGCRVKAATDGSLWVGTGDAAQAANPQSPQSLGGKILHVDRNGMPVSGNQGAPFDPRVFSYGHRNIQGIVLFDEPRNNVFGYSIEHGSDVDDEINVLVNGNFGWAPKRPYIERGVAMTDTVRFPDAIPAIWSSGATTIAPSGATLLKGKNWGIWNGAVAMAVLKGKHVRIMRFDETNKLIEEKPILEDLGRIRSATLGADGALYLTTDNGTRDKVVKIEASIR